MGSPRLARVAVARGVSHVDAATNTASAPLDKAVSAVVACHDAATDYEIPSNVSPVISPARH